MSVKHSAIPEGKPSGIPGWKVAVILGSVLLALVGIGLAAYPKVADWYNQRHQSVVESEYRQELEQLPEEAITDALEAARAYNRFLATGNGAPGKYDELLDLTGTGIMAYIEIPAIHVNLPVYHGVGEDALQRGAGHMPQSSLPVGGASTHAVISAHSGLASAQMFSALGRLQPGDRFTIRVLGLTLEYEVDSIATVLPSETDLLAILPGEDLVTLVTCTPFGVNSHRLLVRGHRVS